MKRCWTRSAQSGPGDKALVLVRKLAPWILRAALLAAASYVIATHFAWRQVAASFSRLQPLYLVPIVLFISPTAVLLRCLRWRGLVPNGQRVPVLTYVRAYLIGFLANSLMPGKLGDLVKARMICRPGVAYACSLGSALIDRVLEGVALLLVLAPAMWFFDGAPVWAHRLALSAAAIAVCALLATALLFRYRQALLGWSEHPLRFFPSALRKRLSSWLEALLAGFESMTSGRRMLSALGYSLAVWVLEIVVVCTFLAAFSIPAPRLPAALLIVVALNFGTLLPVSPGSVGIYQLLCVFALSGWGVDRDLSFGMGLAMQAVLFLPMYAAGLVCAIPVRAGMQAGSSAGALALQEVGFSPAATAASRELPEEQRTWTA